MAHNLIIHIEGFTNNTFKWVASKDFATWHFHDCNNMRMVFCLSRELKFVFEKITGFFSEYIFRKPPLHVEIRAHLTLVLYVTESSSSELLVSHIWLNKLCKEGRKENTHYKIAGQVGVSHKQS